MPVNADSLAELRRGLASLANRGAQRQYMEQLVREASVDIAPAAAWLLLRLELDKSTDLSALARAHGVDAAHVQAAVGQLVAHRLIEAPDASHRGSRRYGVTTEGCAVLTRIIGVRRRHLAEAAAEWHTDEHSAATLRELGRELVPDARPTAD